MRLEGGWEIGSFLETSMLKESKRSTEWLLDALDSIRSVLVSHGETFDEAINDVLNEHRIAFRMVEGQMVSMGSDELQQQVVEPALRLLVGRQFQSAHDAYFKALDEITKQDAGDAITDAGTALQETLTALGCEGNVLGKLLNDAKKKGILGGHDQALIDGVLKFANWAAAERNLAGDSHHHTDATLADAWLMVHVVGALIVRLADPGGVRGVEGS